MWNDEDNNPYGSFERRESTAFDAPQTGSQIPRKLWRRGKLKVFPNVTWLNIQQGSGFERPSTPNSGNSSPANEPPEFVSQPQDMNNDDDEDNTHRSSGNLPRKKGGYDSRLEQLLCEDQDLQIIIVDAGKSQESGGSFISYTIRTGVGSIRCLWLICDLLIILCRTWKCEGDTPSSALCEQLWSIYILL